MKARIIPKVTVWAAALLSVCCCMGCVPFVAHAEQSSANVDGKVYSFNNKSSYDYTSVDEYESTSESDTCGQFVLNGTLTADGTEANVPSYSVSGEEVSFAYTFPDALCDAQEDAWHLVSDSGKNVAGVKLETKIQKGAVIVQTSKDGQVWVEDEMLTDAFAQVQEPSVPFYTTKSVQLANGCYYRIIVAYKTGIKTGQSQILVFKKNNYEYKKTAEVYEFYLHDAMQGDKTENTETKALGELKRAEKENGGYAGIRTIGINDPHYGWSLGQFFVSGYTRETKNDSGTPVFLKTVGDQVTLWFQLQQDINRLNGEEILSIADDNKGYDQTFQTEKTDMGRGTLIIRYTDEKGVKPEIYTNYLEANATTSADTIVRLFEEGDYEVALDYKVKKAPRKVANIEVIPEYSDYRIAFSFLVRNGNCMVYPFDVKTGAELTDEAVTPNGFKLDMAKSKYLTIDVQYARVVPGANGYVEDVRFNRPAKDGDEYTDEGIYTFSVNNLFTGESTTKRIYVGEADYLMALSVNNFSVSDLNERIASGAEIQPDGELVAPNTAEAESAGTSAEAIASPIQEEQIEGQEEPESSVESIKEKKGRSSGVMLLVGGTVCLVVGVFAFFAVKKQKMERHKRMKDGDGA